MRTAEGTKNYERAAELRDVINSLSEIGRASRDRKFARDMSPKIGWQSEMEELQRVLNLPVLPRHVEGFDISNISGTLSVASSVCFQNGRPHKEHYRHAAMKR